MSISSALCGSHHNGAKLHNWQIYRSQLSLDLPSQDEFISDVRRPSLLSVTLSDSVSDHSSLDCNDLNISVFEEEPVKDTNVLQQNTYERQINRHLVQQKSNKTQKNHDISRKNLELEDLKISSNVSDPSQKAVIMKSLSMHDVSRIPTFSLGMKQNSAASCETIHSQSLSSTTKSKDSGFHRSVSCLSLNSGSRSYDHVQSKVKEYIRGIKEREAQRKKHFIRKQHSDEEKQESTINTDTLETEDLVETISKMELELKEKSVMLDAQQKNYNNLLKKLAEAENTIDQLRLRRSSNFYDSYQSSRDSLYHSQPYSYLNSNNLSLGISMEKLYCISQPEGISRDSTKQKELIGNNDSSVSSNNQTSNKYAMSPPCTIIENAEVFSPGECSTPALQSPRKSELRPVTRLFSSSCRLDRTFTPLTKAEDNKNIKYYTSRHSVSQNRSKNEQTESLDQSEKSSYSYINSVQQRRKTLSSGIGNHIDLPKVDPFDKVKKWQASLPSIHLLGFDHSASNSDAGDNNLKSPQLVKTIRKSADQGLSKNELNGVITRTSGVGRFSKSEQDLSCLKSLQLSDSHLKNSSLKKENNKTSENKISVSSSQKCTDLSLPLYLTTYCSTYNDEVETSNDSNRYNEFRAKYCNGLSIKSDYPNSSIHFSQCCNGSLSHQVFSRKNGVYKQSHNTKSADFLKTGHSHIPSNHTSDIYSDFVSFKDSKCEVNSHYYSTNVSNEISDTQKQPITTVFDCENTDCEKKEYVKRTSLNSRSVVQPTSKYSVCNRSKNTYDNRSDYKVIRRITTDTLPNSVMSQKEDNEDDISMSSILSSLSEYKFVTPANYKSLNSPKRKKYSGDKYVPNKIKKIADQKPSVLPVISSEVENRTEKCERFEFNGNKNTEKSSKSSTALRISEMRKCKRTDKNDVTSVLVNGYRKGQGVKKYVTADKRLEERNFLHAKQTPLPADDAEQELVTDTYRINKSLKESLKDSEYFANLMIARLRRMKMTLEDMQTETPQA